MRRCGKIWFVKKLSPIEVGIRINRNTYLPRRCKAIAFMMCAEVRTMNAPLVPCERHQSYVRNSVLQPFYFTDLQNTITCTRNNISHQGIRLALRVCNKEIKLAPVMTVCTTKGCRLRKGAVWALVVYIQSITGANLWSTSIPIVSRSKI